MADYDEQQLQHIERHFRRRSNYAVHAVFYLCSVILFFLFLHNPASARQWMTLPNTGDLLLLLIIWTVIFAAHSVRFYFQEQMERSLRRAMSDLDAGSKRKVKPGPHYAHLTDDGELVDWPEEADDPQDADPVSLRTEG